MDLVTGCECPKWWCHLSWTGWTLWPKRYGRYWDMALFSGSTGQPNHEVALKDMDSNTCYCRWLTIRHKYFWNSSHRKTVRPSDDNWESVIFLVFLSSEHSRFTRLCVHPAWFYRLWLCIFLIISILKEMDGTCPFGCLSFGSTPTPL